MILGIIFLYFYLSLILFFVYKKKFFSKNRFNKVSLKKLDTNLDYTRNRYNYNKIPDKLDNIIIGSGIGSLTSAALLYPA